MMAGVVLTSSLAFLFSLLFLVAGIYVKKKKLSANPKYFFLASGLLFLLGAALILFFLVYF